MQDFWKALYDYNADLILSGSEHVYERFAPQTPTGMADAERGIRQIRSARVAAATTASSTRCSQRAGPRPADTFGVLDVTLRSGAYDWRFVPQAGKVFTDTRLGRLPLTTRGRRAAQPATTALAGTTTLPPDAGAMPLAAGPARAARRSRGRSCR